MKVGEPGTGDGVVGCIPVSGRTETPSGTEVVALDDHSQVVGYMPSDSLVSFVPVEIVELPGGLDDLEDCLSAGDAELKRNGGLPSPDALDVDCDEFLTTHYPRVEFPWIVESPVAVAAAELREVPGGLELLEECLAESSPQSRNGGALPSSAEVDFDCEEFLAELASEGEVPQNVVGSP